VRFIIHPGRVKGRSYDHPLLIKPPVQITRRRLSFGLSHSRRWQSSIFQYCFHRSDCSAVFHHLHLLVRWRFSLLYFRSYLPDICYIRLMLLALSTLDSIQSQDPFARSGFLLTQSPPVPCGTGSVCHWHDHHSYYEYI